MNGNGYMVWSDCNEKYVGQWTDNLQNGLGIHIWYESKGEQKYLRNRYVGEWKNGHRHGYGVFFYSNGSKYEGTWDQNYKHGYGIFTFYDGSHYMGRFNSDRMIDYNTLGVYAPVTTTKVPETTKSTFNSNRGLPRRSFAPKSEDESAQTKQDKFNSTSNSTSIADKEVKEKPKIVTNLEAIPEGNELLVSSNTKETASNFQIKNFSPTTNNPALPNPNITSSSILQENLSITNKPGNVISNKASKESESNLFKTSMDITDIIECEPEIEKSLREVENILLRHLSEIKRWYLYYTNKDKDSLKDGDGIFENSLKQTNTLNIYLDKYNKTDVEDKKKFQSGAAILPNVEKPHTISDGIYNNDLGFCMELKDLWKFIRECKILSSDFTLAQFNRIFFKGPKNYIEMFMCPDDIDQKKLYDYIYLMINKSKKEFYTKHRQHVEKKKVGDTVTTIVEIPTGPNAIAHDKNTNFSHANLNYMPSDLEINFDIHNKRQVILLRQFYEAILRIAYLKFFDLNQPLNVKLNMLIDNYIKFNPHFKKVPRKQNVTSHFGDSSVNSSILDMKVKTFETNLEYFLSTFDIKLRQIFKQLYLKSTPVPKKHDMTITYIFFYESIVLNCKPFADSIDRYKYVELVNLYHKDKIIITEDNKSTKEIFTYIENLLESEMIFFEFCEMVFYISRNYFMFSNIQENKNHYEEAIRMISDVLNKKELYKVNKEKYDYSFPKLPNHVAYEKILEMKRQKDEEEQKKRDEIKRVKIERSFMMNEDLNVLPKEDDEENLESYEEDEISSY